MRDMARRAVDTLEVPNCLGSVVVSSQYMILVEVTAVIQALHLEFLYIGKDTDAVGYISSKKPPPLFLSKTPDSNKIST